MAFINFSSGEIQCKIIYYGPGLGGKTTNLRYIYDSTNDHIRGQLVSIDTKGDRTLFFDFLSLDLGKIRDYKIRVQLYTVPGQVHYDATRKLVLRGADGIVFVADSMRVQREKNIESLENMAVNLKEKGLDITKIPLVLQYNKRDLEGSNIPILAIDEIQRDLNAHLNAPFFTASALKGEGVFETLREISKLTVRDVSRKVLSKGKT
jgi:signal recognition particle receptor subunit beta